MTSEFEATMEGMQYRMTQQTQHHEQTQSSWAIFTNHVKHMINTMEEMGNPFIEEAKELMILHAIEKAQLQFYYPYSFISEKSDCFK